MKGRTVCLAHGGRTPRGVASPHFRTGRHSRDLPTRLAVRFEAAEGDPRLLELRGELALLDARIEELLGQLDRGEGDEANDAPLWREIVALIDRRRHLVEAEAQRLALAEEMLTPSEAMTLVATLTAAVRKHVRDPKVLTAIGEDISRILEE